MKIKALLPLLALAASGSAMANDYQTFSSINYSEIDTANASADGWWVTSQHYLGKKESLGPLNEFDYINNTSNVFGTFADWDGDNYWNLGGDIFLGNIKLGATYSDSDGYNTKSFRLGYLVTDDFLVELEGVDSEGFDTEYWLSAQYTMQLKGKDYVGFTYRTDDELDVHNLSAKYFTSLGGDRYLTTGVQLSESDFGSYWGVNAGYYFSKFTSIQASYDEDEDYDVMFKHYFTNNYAFNAGYMSSFDDSDFDGWTIGFSGQF